MKNVIKNNDGTLDLLGLTKVEAFTLLMLTGDSSSVLTGDVYRNLAELFPLYDWGKLMPTIVQKPNYSTFCGDGDAVKIKNAAERFFKKDEVAKVFVQKPTVLVNNLPKRDSKGRFKAKDWVAEFWYPANGRGELTWRRVIVSKDSPRSNPNSDKYSQIRGFDVTKDALRCFDSGKICGSVTWSQE